MQLATISRLTADIATFDKTAAINEKCRIAFMKEELAKPPGRTALRYFPAKIPYFVKLSGKPNIRDTKGIVAPQLNLDVPWIAELWAGCWDPDALSGYLRGFISIPTKDDSASSAASEATLSGLIYD